MEREYVLEPTVPSEFSLEHPLDDGLAAPDWELILKPDTSVLMHGFNPHMSWGRYAARVKRIAERKLGGDKLPSDIQDQVNSQLEGYRVTAEEWAITEGFLSMPDIRKGDGDPYLWTVQHHFPTGDPPHRRSFKRIAFLQQSESGGRKPSREGVRKAVHRVAILLPLKLGAAPNRPAEIPDILRGPLTGSRYSVAT